MDEVEVFFDTQTLEVFAFNNEEGYHLELPLRNRIVIKWSTFEKRDDGVDITLKKTRIGRWRSVQPLKGGYDIGKEAMQVKLEDQARYDLFDAIQNNELRNWLETYPYHCLACNAIFDEVYKGDGASRELWSYFKQKPPPPPKSANKTTRAWKAYGDKIEAEFEFDYTCDRVMSMRATTFGTSAIVGSDVDFACNLIVNNRTFQEALIHGYKYIQHAMHGAPETAHAWDGQPSLKKIVETAPDLIPQHRDAVCGMAAEACGLVSGHSFNKCEACNSIILLTDGILAYPRGDYPRDREEVEELVQNDLCGFPVKSRIGDNAVVAEVCEELLDEYETEIINTLTYKQKPAENIKLNPSSVPPAVNDFCAQQTHFVRFAASERAAAARRARAAAIRRDSRAPAVRPAEAHPGEEARPLRAHVGDAHEDRRGGPAGGEEGGSQEEGRGERPVQGLRHHARQGHRGPHVDPGPARGDAVLRRRPRDAQGALRGVPEGALGAGARPAPAPALWRPPPAGRKGRAYVGRHRGLHHCVVVDFD
jgi:hypothetical protein